MQKLVFPLSSSLSPVRAVNISGAEPNQSIMENRTGKKWKRKESRAGIVFPVARVKRYLKEGNYADRIGVTASIYLAATLAYLVAEVFDLSGTAAQQEGKTRIQSRHLMLAIRHDDELNELLARVTIPGAGVKPKEPAEEMPRKFEKTSKPKKVCQVKPTVK